MPVGAYMIMDEATRYQRTALRCKILDVLHAADALTKAKAELQQSEDRVQELKRWEEERRLANSEQQEF